MGRLANAFIVRVLSQQTRAGSYIRTQSCRFVPSAACLASSPWLGGGSRRGIAGTAPKFCDDGRIPITFLDSRAGKDGIKVKAKLGNSLLEVAREHDIELEGACEGTLACSTCHCVFEKSVFEKLPAITDEEMDMLDLAAALTDTSRLGCQIKVTETLRDAIIRIPDEFNNLYGSGGGNA